MMEVIMSRKTAREDTFKLLFSTEVGNHAPACALDTYFADDIRDKSQFSLESQSDEDKVYIRSTVAAVHENFSLLDSIIKEHSSRWDVTRLSKVSLTLLRLAIYEIKFCPKVPVAVAISEAVRIAKKYDGPEAGSFINGILGSFARSLNPPQAEETV